MPTGSTIPTPQNTTLFDPARFAPLTDLAARAQLVFGRHWPEKMGTAVDPGSGDTATTPAGAAPAGSVAASSAPAPAAAGERRPFVFISSFKWEVRLRCGLPCPDGFGRVVQARSQTHAYACASQPRKGWDVLLEAYLSEFSPEDDVELYILTKPYAGSGEAVRGWDCLLRTET